MNRNDPMTAENLRTLAAILSNFKEPMAHAQGKDGAHFKKLVREDFHNTAAWCWNLADKLEREQCLTL